MRQVLLAPQEPPKPSTGNGRVHSTLRHYANRTNFPPTVIHHRDPRRQKPFVMWLNDDAEVGDVFNWNGQDYVVSQVYGTHLSISAIIRKCDKPKRQSDQGNGIAVPIDR
jgi:hypothetical protein